MNKLKSEEKIVINGLESQNANSIDMEQFYYNLM